MIKQLSFIIIPATFIVMSCGANKNFANDDNPVTSEESSEEFIESETDSKYTIGKVVLSEDGCTLKLIPENEDNICYYPVNLDEMFKVDGAILQFVMYPSRASMPIECGSCRTIQLENVVRLKR